MPRLVEDAGKPLYAGWLSRYQWLSGTNYGVRWVGGRRAEWLLGDSLTITHAPAHPPCDPVTYTVKLDYTAMPSGGFRWWWKCPACERRVDLLYLPKDRDQMACRGCCGLSYRSQHTRRKVRRRNWRPVVEGNYVHHWIWLPPWRRR
jgi:hypothetical protein